jgi:hypothetical protein
MRIVLTLIVLCGLISCISFPEAERKARMRAERGGAEEKGQPIFYNPLSGLSSKKAGGTGAAANGGPGAPAVVQPRPGFRDPYFRTERRD